METVATLLVLATLLLAPVEIETNGMDDDGGQRNEACNVYGDYYQIGVGNSYQCSSYAHFCDQRTGSGAGAGAGGQGSNRAGAEATTGTECNNSANNNQGDGCAAGAGSQEHVEFTLCMEDPVDLLEEAVDKARALVA